MFQATKEEAHLGLLPSCITGRQLSPFFSYLFFVLPFSKGVVSLSLYSLSLSPLYRSVVVWDVCEGATCASLQKENRSDDNVWSLGDCSFTAHRTELLFKPVLFFHFCVKKT